MKMKMKKLFLTSLKVLTAVLIVSLGFLFYFAFSANFARQNPETPLLTRIAEAAAGAIKIGRNLDFQNVYTVKGVPWPQQPKDAASKEYVDDVCGAPGPIPTGAYIPFIDMSNYLSYLDPDGYDFHVSVEVREVGGVGDFENDGDLDIAFITGNGYLGFYDILSDSLNITTVHARKVGSIGDVDSDGYNEVVYSYQDDLYIYEYPSHTSIPVYNSEPVLEIGGLGGMGLFWYLGETIDWYWADGTWLQGYGVFTIIPSLSLEQLSGYYYSSNASFPTIPRVGAVYSGVPTGVCSTGELPCLNADVNYLCLTTDVDDCTGIRAIDVGAVTDIDNDGSKEVVYVGEDNNLKCYGCPFTSFGILAKRVGLTTGN